MLEDVVAVFVVVVVGQVGHLDCQVQEEHQVHLEDRQMEEAVVAAAVVASDPVVIPVVVIGPLSRADCSNLVVLLVVPGHQKA